MQKDYKKGFHCILQGFFNVGTIMCESVVEEKSEREETREER